MLRNTINRLFFNRKKKKESKQPSEQDEQSSSESDEELRSAKRFIRNYRKKVANLQPADYCTKNQASLSSLASNLKDYKMYVTGLQQKRLEKERDFEKQHKPSYIGRLFNMRSRKKAGGGGEEGLRSYLNNRGPFSRRLTSECRETVDSRTDDNRLEGNCLDFKDKIRHLNRLDSTKHHLSDEYYRVVGNRASSNWVAGNRVSGNRATGSRASINRASINQASISRASLIGPNASHLNHISANQIHTNTFSNQQLIRELEELRCRRKLNERFNERFELENYFRPNCKCRSGALQSSGHFSTGHFVEHLPSCPLKERSATTSPESYSGDEQRSIPKTDSSCDPLDSGESLNLSYMDSEQQLYQNNYSGSTESETEESEEEEVSEDRYLDTYTIESANTEDNPISSESFTKLIRKLTYSDTMRTRLLELCDQSDALDFEQEFSKEKYPTVLNLDSGTFAVTFLALDKENNFVVLKVIRTVAKEVQNRLSQLSYSGTETFDEVYGEVMISRALSSLHRTRGNRAHCFPQVLYTKLVAGRVPDNFRITKLKDSKPEPFKCATLDQFRQRTAAAAAAAAAAGPDNTPSTTTQSMADRKKFLKQEPFRLFTDSPVEYTVIAMKYVGKPIWKRLLNRQLNAQQMFGIVQQLIFGLVCAERQFNYEHRDLHISNILIKRTKKPEVDFVIDNRTYKLTTLGYRCFIVDMTFSRLTVNEQVFYKDLSSVLYKRQEAENKKLKMQDMVYQLMRDEIGDAWHKFRPRTNLHWLIYVMKTIKDCELFKRNNDLVAQLLTDYYNYANKCRSLDELVDYIVQRSADIP